MRKIAFAAATLALTALPALAQDLVTGTIDTINTKERVLVLEDKTQMIVGEDVDLTTLEPGMKVRIHTRVDEDGQEAATKVEPAE